MNRPRHSFPLALLLTLAATASGCHRSAEPQPPPSAPPSATVAVATASRQGRSATADLVGTVRARVRATLEAKISGRITRLPFDLGQPVRQGQVVAELAAQEVQARFDQAQAAVEQTRRERQRFVNLLEQKAATPQEFDAIDSRHRIAEAALAEAQSVLDYVRIPAPFDGVVSRRFVDVGDLASPGRPLLEIEDPTAFRFETDIPEDLLGRIQIGATLLLRVDSLDQNLEGTVSEIAPAAEAGSRTFRVKLNLPATAGLRTGQFGRLAIPTGQTTSLQLPAAAIVPRGQMELVFVVRDGRAHLRLVKTGRRFGGEVEILSGLDDGDTVALDAAQLIDGQPVQTR